MNIAPLTSSPGIQETDTHAPVWDPILFTPTTLPVSSGNIAQLSCALVLLGLLSRYENTCALDPRHWCCFDCKCLGVVWGLRCCIVLWLETDKLCCILQLKKKQKMNWRWSNYIPSPVLSIKRLQSENLPSQVDPFFLIFPSAAINTGRSWGYRETTRLSLFLTYSSL